MFQQMMERIQEEVARYIMKAHVEINLKRQKVAEGETVYRATANQAVQAAR